MGIRKDKSIAVQGLRLCGCVESDKNDSEGVCSSYKNFVVPVAKIGIQECLNNSHCLHKTFAYCMNNKCAKFSGIAATAGAKIYQCLVGKNCTINNIATKTINETMKILPVAQKVKCGVDMALDPDYFDSAVLPCVLDLNNDGKCDINLGMVKTMNSNRLCGCSGSDRGGNGRPCDEPADFDIDLGFVKTVECNIDEDCKSGLCAANQCVSDTVPPTFTRMIPENNTIVIPPVIEISLVFSENIMYPPNNENFPRVLIKNMDRNLEFEIFIADPTKVDPASTFYRTRIEGTDLIINPDIRLSTFPEGKYIVIFEGGIVMDMDGNLVEGKKDLSFTILSDAGCPFFGITGLSILPINGNGIYKRHDSYNDRPTWILKTLNGNLFLELYFSKQKDKNNKNHLGVWVISPLGAREVKFYAMFEASDSQIANFVRPISGSWQVYSEGTWTLHENVILSCLSTVDLIAPVLTSVSLSLLYRSRFPRKMVKSKSTEKTLF